MFGSSKPLAQGFAIGHAELRYRVRDVEFHGVETDSAPCCDLTVGHAVLNRMYDAPLGRR